MMADLALRSWRRGWLGLLVVLSALLTVISPAMGQSVSRVEEIGIRLDLSGGFVGPETLSQLERALLDTAELALLDQLGGDLAYITNHQDVVVDTLGSVFDDELNRRGFALEELVLEPGVVTRVTVKLHLAEQRVNDFRVRFYLLGNTPVQQAVTSSDEEAVAAELYATVARTPYRDESWLSNLVTRTVESQLARLVAYADFEHKVLVAPGPTTEVAVTFTPLPQAPALTDYSLHLRSYSIPMTALVPVRERAGYYLQALMGAPLSFASSKLPALQQALYQQLVNTGPLAAQCAEASLELVINDCVLDADIRADSTRWLLGGEARLALWDYTAGDLVGRLDGRAGLLLGPNWSAFGYASYYPAEEVVYPALCVGPAWDFGWAAAGYDFKAQSLRFLGQLELTPQVYLSADAFPDDDLAATSEISVHYRVRDFYELQLFSNLDGEVVAAVAACF
jgi:hypothetical protein